MGDRNKGVQDVSLGENSQKPSLSGRLIQLVAEYIPSRAVFLLLNASITLSVLFFLSVFFYGAFYYTYIPQAQYMKLINFQRTEVTKTRKVPTGETFVTRRELQVDIPMSSAGDGFLASGQVYTILLELNLPDSEVNINAGMFSIAATFYDKADNILTSSSRLVMLRYRSWLLRTMETIIYSPFYILGLSDQVQLRRVELFKHYKENVYRPTTLITVSIDNPDIQVYEATIILHVKFSGIRYYMYYWPISSAVLGIISLNSLLLLTVMSSYLTITMTKSDSDATKQTPNTKSKILNCSENQPDDSNHVGRLESRSKPKLGTDEGELRKRKCTPATS